MARCCSVLLLLGFVIVAGAAAVAVAGAAAVPGGGGCEVSALAAEVAASCASGAATRPCCEPVLASVELGGGACLCRLASEMPVLHAGLNGSALAALYAGCGGDAAASLAACHGPQPSRPVALFLPSTTAAGVVKDRVGATPPSASSLGGPLSPPQVIQVIIKLASDDRKLLREVIVWQLIPTFLVLIIVAVKVRRRIFRRRKA